MYNRLVSYMVYILNIIHPKEASNIDVVKTLDKLGIECREPNEPMVTYARNSQMDSSIQILPSVEDSEECRKRIRKELNKKYGLHEKTVIELRDKSTFI